VATYYWVGGTGTWNSTSTTNWAASSGGPGGAGYPTILDDVVFDTSSGTGTVSPDINYSFCRDFTVTASQSLTIINSITGVAGNLSLPAGGTFSASNCGFILTANSAKTITTNGKSISGLTCNGLNGSWTLQDMLNVNNTTSILAGTFNTNNQTVITGTFTSTGSSVRAINLGSTGMQLSQIGNTAWQMVPTNLTFNAGTSSIYMPGNAAAATTFTGGGLTYNDFYFNVNGANAVAVNILDANTFNKMSFSSPTIGIAHFVLSANQTTGSIGTGGGAVPPTARALIRSDIIGTQRTLNIASITTSLLSLDFRDIAVTGAVGTLSGTSFGDCGNNSGITFDTPKTVYWNAAFSQWSDTGWATSSGGTPNVANFPLAQDTCIINNASAGSSLTINSRWNIGTLNTSSRTTAFSLFTSVEDSVFYGNFLLGTGVTPTNANRMVFSKYNGVQEITTNGVTFSFTPIINSPTTTFRLLDNFSCANNGLTLTAGTLDLNNFSFTILNGATFTITSNSLSRSIAFGTGNITLAGTNANTFWSTGTLTNFTVTGTPTVNLTGAATSGQRTIQHGSTVGATEANAISINVSAGSGASIVSLAGSFKNINLTGFAANFANATRTIYGNLLISTGTTVTGGSNVTTFAGTSTTNDLTSNGKTLDFPITIGGTGNTLRLLDALNQSTTSYAFTINSGTTFNANTFSASVGALTITTTASNPNITNLASNTLTAQIVTHTGGSLIMSASFKVNVTNGYSLTGSSTLDLGNQSVSFGTFSSGTTATRTLNLGSGTLTITGGGGTVFSMSSGTFILNAGTSTINFTSASAKTMSSIAALTYYNINQGGAGALTLQTSSCIFNIISNSVQPTTILFSSTNTLTVANLNLNGTAGNLVTLGPSSAASTYTVDYIGSTVNTMNYVSVSYFIGGRAGTFFATNSTNTAGNTNITFAAADTTPRYWVGGTGTWTNTATANWATSSGGGGGASAPTIETNVFFDAASNVGTGAFTVTLSGTDPSALVCNGLTISGLDGTLTWAGSGGLNVYGSLSYPATSFNRTYSGIITFRSTTTGRTITTNGQQISGATVIFNGVGGGWTLADAYNNGIGQISVSAGSLNTNGFAVTVSALTSNSLTARSIILGASTVTLSSNITLLNTSNLTFNAGTSTFVLTDSNINAGTLGNIAFYNVNWVGTTNTNVNILGPLTFNNVQLTATASSNAKPFQFDSNVTINGTLSILSTTPTSRVLLFSNTFGTQRTLTVNSFTSPSDVDFRDIAIAGTAAPVSGTRLGNAGGNSGITFDAPKTVYFNLVGGSAWFQTAWATTPSGTPNVNNFPLAQDTAAFTDVGAISSMGLAVTNYSYPTIDSSARTLALTISQSSSLDFYGGWINGTGITLTGNFARTFRGRGSYNIASNGVTFSGSVTIDCISGTYTLTSAFLLTSGTLTITSGNFNSGNQTINLSSFASSSSTTRSITFGTSTINVDSSGSTPFNLGVITNLTFSGASSTINFTHNSGNTVTFAGGGLTYGTFNIGGTTGSGTYQISGTGTTFNNITKTKPVAFSLSLSASTTINFANFNISGSAGNLVTLGGASGSTTGLFNYTGTGVVSVDYVSAGTNNAFRPLPTATTPYKWYLGANSTNTLTATPTPTNFGAVFIASTKRAYLLTFGTTSWTVPEDWDVNNNNFYLIGVGGGCTTSASSGNNRAAAGGGGGGAYVGLTNLALSPGAIIPVSVPGTSSGLKGLDVSINSQYLAGGGQAGTATTAPLSTGGAGGIAATYNGTGVLYNGGAGGVGSFGTTAGAGYAGGGGGGAGGPNGVGGAGGAGFGGQTVAINNNGGGGGGNGGGSAGTAGTSVQGGTGGNNFNGTGGGVNNVSGTAGGGGGGGSSVVGQGGSGRDIQNSLGGSGGSGGSYSSSTGNTGQYGGGSGGVGVTIAGGGISANSGAAGLIFIVYTPLSGFFASITEAFTSNNIQSAQSVFNRSITENSTLAAAQQVTSTFARDITEAITVADNQSVVAIYAGVITEGQGIADNQTVSGIFNADTTDGLTVASIQSVSANFNSAITEDSTILSVEDAIKAVFSSITENSNLADNQSVFAYFNVTRTENFDPAALQSVQANFNSLINENLVVLDEFVGRGWFRIVDNQTVTWAAINNGQTVTWQNVGNDQNPNWVVVNNSQE
jgi:hypothetical protein